MKRGNKGIYGQLLKLAIIPLLISGIAIAITTNMTFTKAIQTEVQRGLHSVSALTIRAYDRMYPGDYHLELEEDTYRLYKGDKDITDVYDFIDLAKKDTGIDFSFFFYDTRMMTTICDEDGDRIVGTKAHSTVISDVFEEHKSMFYNNVSVNGEKYFAYYTPLYNQGGTCVGMFFAGKPTRDIQDEISQSLFPIFAVTIVMIGISCLLCNSYAKDVAMVISRIRRFLGELAEGNLKPVLDCRIMQRQDELGEMARFTVRVQYYLREMVERDGLTKLYSRRIGTKMMQNTHKNYEEQGVPYCVAICDIDHFKKFNDTYGHDCGDVVLAEIAGIFNQMLMGKGFTIRWGGEEFLIVFENLNLENSYDILDKIRQVVIDREIVYKEQTLKITMTYGLAYIENHEELHETIKAADTLLYEGKAGGRNRIVVEQND